MEKAKVETIDNETIITIELSGAFYSDLQFTLHHLCRYKSDEEISELIKKISSEDTPDNFSEWEIAARTLFALCSGIESRAKKLGAIKEVEIDIDSTTTAPPTNI